MLDLGKARHLFEQQCELITPEPCDHVGGSHARLQPPGHFHQEAVAGGVPEAVVHRLEVVAVDEQDTEPIVRVPPRARQRLRQALDEGGAVRQIGDRVAQRPAQQLSLGLPAVRDIPGDRGGANRMTVWVENRRDADRHLDARAVLSHARGLVVLNVLAAPQALEDAGQLVPVVRWNDQRDRLSDRLLGRVAVEARRGWVPCCDRSIKRFADNGIVRRFHHGLEVRDGGVGPLELRDVSRDAAGVHELPVLQPSVRTEQHVADRSIAVPQPRLDIADGLSRAQTPQDIVNDLRVDVELAHVLTDILVASIAHEIQLGGVGPHDGAVRPEPAQTDRRMLKKVLEIERCRGAIAHVYRHTDHAHNRARLVSQWLHVHVVAAALDPNLVRDRLARERPPMRIDRVGAHCLLGELIEEGCAYHALWQDVRREASARPRRDPQLGVGGPENRRDLFDGEGKTRQAFYVTRARRLAVGVAEQPDTHARQLECHPFAPAPLDTGGRRSGQLAADPRDTPALFL